jgi:Protein of unknown function (DUF4197)
VRSLWMPLVLLGLLWIGLTCTHLAPNETTALSGVNELLGAACERALASLAPDPEPARRVLVSLPVELGPALRALHGTGMGGRVVALEAAVERTARLALADAKPWLEHAASSFAPEDPEALISGSGDALSVAFRAATEAELRAQLRPAAERRLGETGAFDALVGVRNGASRLPLPRTIELDLVSFVTEQAIAHFFVALAQEERQLREERMALLDRMQTGREAIR